MDTNKTKYPQGFDVILKLNMSQTCFRVWDITVRRKGKVKRVTEFVEKMREEARTALRKV